MRYNSWYWFHNTIFSQLFFNRMRFKTNYKWANKWYQYWYWSIPSYRCKQSSTVLIKANLKLQSVTFFWLKMIQNQFLGKYITNQSSKLSPYLSTIHNGKLIIMFSHLSGTGRFSWEIQACRHSSLRHVCKYKEGYPASRLYRTWGCCRWQIINSLFSQQLE